MGEVLTAELDYKLSVAQQRRTRDQVDAVVQKTGEDIKAFFEGIEKQIAPQALAKFIRKKRKQAQETITKERETGQKNDNSSIAPGLVAYFTKEGFEATAQQCKELGYPIDESSTQELEGGVIAVLLPDGTYDTSRGGCQFYMKSVLDPATGNFASIMPFSANREDIAGIVGFEGEIWQNSALPLQDKF